MLAPLDDETPEPAELLPVLEDPELLELEAVEVPELEAVELEDVELEDVELPTLWLALERERLCVLPLPFATTWKRSLLRWAFSCGETQDKRKHRAEKTPTMLIKRRIMTGPHTPLGLGMIFTFS